MRKIKIFFTLLFITSLLVACGGSNAFDSIADKNSDEAERVDLSRAISDADYDYVINKLEDRTNLDKEYTTYLVDAYLGKAGINFIEPFKNIDNVDDPYSFITTMLGTDEISKADIDERREYLVKSYIRLGYLNPDGSIIERNSRLKLEMCNIEDSHYKLLGLVAGSVDTLFSTTKLIIDGSDNSSDSSGGSSDNSTSDNEDEKVDIAKDALKAYIINYLHSEYGDDVDALKTALIAKLDDVDLEKIRLRIRMLLCGSNELTSDDVKEKLEDFVRDIKGTEVYDIYTYVYENPVTKEEFVDYIIKKIAEIE